MYMMRHVKKDLFGICLQTINAVELQWLEQLWNYENMSETGVVRVNHSASSEGKIGISFSILFNTKICCVISLEAILMSTRVHNIPFSIIKKKITLNYPKSSAMGFS